MKILEARTSGETPLRQLFVGKTITGFVAEDKPRRGGVTLEIDGISHLYVWCEVVEIEEWHVTGALRVIEDFSRDLARGVASKFASSGGILVSSASLMYADFELDGVEMSVANGLALFGSLNEKITIISSSGAGTMDIGLNVELDSLETEYPSECYRLVPL